MRHAHQVSAALSAMSVSRSMSAARCTLLRAPRPDGAAQRESHLRVSRALASEALGSETHEREEIGEFDQTLRLFPFRLRQGHAVVLAIEQGMEASVNAPRQAKTRQILRHLELNGDRL